jgi:hypothetical protein
MVATALVTDIRQEIDFGLNPELIVRDLQTTMTVIRLVLFIRIATLVF